MLDEVVVAAVTLIPGTDEGSISLVTGRNVTSHRPCGELPRRIDALQAEVGEGPCLDAVFEHQTVRVPDMANEQRWLNFAPRAAQAGAGGSMLSFQLYVQGDNLGALNLYGHRPNAFDDESEHVGLLFASHAAVAFADAQKIEQLNRAVDSRDLIGQAKGILMERYKINADQAFTVLVRVSQQNNRKLRDLAQELASKREVAGITAPPQP